MRIMVPCCRTSGVVDRTVIFVPDIWNHFGGDEQVKVYKQVHRQEVEVEEEVEVEIEVEEDVEAKEGVLHMLVHLFFLAKKASKWRAVNLLVPVGYIIRMALNKRLPCVWVPP